jgi:membrane AbrB-like protein
VPARSTIIKWLAVAAATAVVALGFDAIGLPSPTLFAALVAGLVYALVVAARAPLTMPGPAMTAAQAVVGVSLGVSVDADTLRAVGQDWAPVLLVTAGTLGLSLGSGLLMARFTGLDRPTACLGLIAGGASGIVAMADELGADGRLVAFMQYLRVLVVVITAPLLAHLVVHGTGHGGSAPGSTGAELAGDLAFTLVCAAGGVLLGRLLRFTASALLVPLVLAAAGSISGLAGGAHVPDLLAQLAFAVIGLQVGLRFTVASLREVGRLLIPTLASIIFLIASCGALAVILLPLTDGVTFGDAYLATTPGGLYAILAAAASLGGNTTFVVAVQALRVFAMVLAAPPLVRLLVRERATPASP